MKQELLSIIVPAYNEESTVKIFLEETEKYTAEMPVDVEYLFVDDGSTDNTMEKLRDLSEKNEKVHYLSFSRNFGKEAAIYAGCSIPAGIMWSSWMQICRTRRLCSRKCTGSSLRNNTTVWGAEGWTEKENRRFALFLPGCFTE